MVALAQEETQTRPVVQEQSITSVTTDQQQSREIAAVRLAHMLPGVPRIDLIIDGRLRIQDVVYGDVSGYVLIPIDKVRLGLMPHVAIDSQGKVLEGSQPPELIPFAATLEPDKYYTLVFSHTDTTESGAQVLKASLVSIFENTFETPLPGQALLHFKNTSAAVIELRVEQQDNQELTVLETLELPLLSTVVLNVPFGSYIFSFADGEAALEVVLQAGTYYTFYVFRDGENLIVNPDVDGVLGLLAPGELSR